MLPAARLHTRHGIATYSYSRCQAGSQSLSCFIVMILVRTAQGVGGLLAGIVCGSLFLIGYHFSVISVGQFFVSYLNDKIMRSH